jgi:hypothetical protein
MEAGKNRVKDESRKEIRKVWNSSKKILNLVHEDEA